AHHRPRDRQHPANPNGTHRHASISTRILAALPTWIHFSHPQLHPSGLRRLHLCELVLSLPSPGAELRFVESRLDEQPALDSFHHFDSTRRIHFRPPCRWTARAGLG